MYVYFLDTRLSQESYMILFDLYTCVILLFFISILIINLVLVHYARNSVFGLRGVLS